jgi:hypothetical protein
MKFAVRASGLEQISFKAGWYGDFHDDLGHVEFDEHFSIYEGKLVFPEPWLETAYIISAEWYSGIEADALSFINRLHAHRHEFSKWTSARFWDFSKKAGATGHNLNLGMFFTNEDDAVLALFILSTCLQFPRK